MFTRVFEHLKNQEAESACMLPNQARYQLRYIPMFFFAILTGFGLAAARSPRSSNTPPACYSPLLGRSPNALRFSHYLRHLGPKEIYADFLLDLQGFSGLSCPKTMLSGAFISNVST